MLQILTDAVNDCDYHGVVTHIIHLLITLLVIIINSIITDLMDDYHSMT